MINNNLENKENYLKKYKSTVIEQISKYMAIINEFSHQIDANFKSTNEEYKKFVIKKGLETLLHVFKFLLLYTKNLELTFYNSKKALYYYIEFISQIGEESHEFLKLTPKDAILFVYKKTIFLLDENYVKSFKTNKTDLLKIENFGYLADLQSRYFFEKLNKNKVIGENIQIVNLFQSSLSFLQSLINLIKSNSINLTNFKLKFILGLILLRNEIDKVFLLRAILNK